MQLISFINDMSIIFLLYTDPGSGALLLQLLMASLLGGLFYVRTIKDKILTFFVSKKSVKDKELNSGLPEHPGNS